MKPNHLLAALLLSLTLTTPSWADYTASAILDLSSLTFSGVPIELISQSQLQGITMVDVDPAALFAGTVTPPFPTFQDGFSDTEWVRQIVFGGLSNVGDARSFVLASQAGSSLTLSGAGLMDSFLDRNSFVRAAESGPLTVSIHYHIGYTDAPRDSGGVTEFSGHTAAQLFLADQSGQGHTALGAQQTLRGSFTQDGILSVTQQLTAGTLGFLSLSTDAQVQQTRSVPLPGMLWPTVLGLWGLAWYAARRRKHSA